MEKLSLLVIVLLSVSVASAEVLEDFQGTYTGAGTLMADPEDSANTVLHLAAEDGTNNAEVFQIAAPDTAGVVTMRLYDFGANTEKVDSRYGPRWGVLGDGGVFTSCMNILYKSYISGYKGYTYNQTQSTPLTPTGAIYSPNWTDGLYTSGRYVKALDDIATPDVDESQGAWATWTFTVADAETVTVAVEANDVVDASGVYTQGPISAGGTAISPVGQMTDIFVSSGTNEAEPAGCLKFVGILVDDVTFSPLGPSCNGGDADGDGDVDLDDFVILKNNFGTNSGATCDMGDFDGDGDVDLDDFVLLKNNFGVTYPS